MESIVEPLKLIVNTISYFIPPWTATGAFCRQENKYDDCFFSTQNLHIGVQFNKVASLKGTEDMAFTVPQIVLF